MPSIPIFRNSRPLADTPGYVKDNLPRPQMDLRGLEAELGTLARSASVGNIDPTPFVERAGALKPIARAIEQAGTIVSAVAEQRNHAKTEADVAEAHLKLDQAKGDFETWKVGKPPSEWDAEWKRISQAATKDILSNPALSSKGRDALGLSSKKWATHGAIDTQIAGAKAEFGRAASATEGRFLQALDARDYSSAAVLVAHGENEGYFHPEATQRLLLQINSRQKDDLKNDTLTGILAAPDAWLAANPAPAKGTDPHDYLAFRSAAEGASRDALGSTVKDLSDYMAKNPLATPADVEGAAAGRLRPGELQRWKDAAAQNLNAAEKARLNDPAVIKQSFGALLDAATVFSKSDVSPNDPAAREAYVNLHIASQMLPEGLRGEVTGPLERKWRAGPPEIDTTVKGYVSQSIGDMFEQGAFGELEKRVPKEEGDPGWYEGTAEMKKIVNVEGTKQAQAARADALIAMNTWMKQNPNATREQATTAMYSLSREAVGKIDAKALFKAAAEKTTAPAAAGFDWSGKAGAVASPVSSGVIDFVKGFEGFQESAYGDYKQTSVGYGTRAKHSAEKLTEAQATQRLKEELSTHAARVDKASAAAGLKLSARQRAALISFDFNTGEGDYLIESSAGNMAEIKRRLLLYTKAGGKDNAGLQARRKKEAALLE